MYLTIKSTNTILMNLDLDLKVKILTNIEICTLIKISLIYEVN